MAHTATQRRRCACELDNSERQTAIRVRIDLEASLWQLANRTGAATTGRVETAVEDLRPEMHALLAGRLAAAAAAAGGGTMRTAQHCDAPTASRRNITLACRCELAEKLAEALKPQAKENQKAGGGDRKSSRAKSGLPILAEPINTREQAAKEAGVSHGSMAAFKFLKENASPEVLDEALKPKARENQKAGLETSSKRGADKSANIGEVVDTREQAAKEAGVSHGSMAAFKSKGWTQERIGEVLGVTRQAIALWIIPNASTCNASTPKPKDCRLKLSKEHCHTQEEIAKRVGLGKMGILDVCKQIEKFQIAYKPSDFDHL